YRGQIFAADGYGEVALESLPVGKLSQPTAWLFGNEARGLSAPELELADARVAVPLYGLAESLNVATAATVCLYASAMAQHKGSCVQRWSSKPPLACSEVTRTPRALTGGICLSLGQIS